VLAVAEERLETRAATEHALRAMGDVGRVYPRLDATVLCRSVRACVRTTCSHGWLPLCVRLA